MVHSDAVKVCLKITTKINTKHSNSIACFGENDLPGNEAVTKDYTTNQLSLRSL